MNFLEVLFMSPLDIIIFTFFILVTIRAASSCIDYWKDAGEDIAVASTQKACKTTASLSRTVRTGRPSSVRVTPIKRVNTPITASSHRNINVQHIPLKDKGAA